MRTCPACPGPKGLRVEETTIGTVTKVGVATHQLRFTLLRCDGCGMVLGVVDGSLVDIARRQGFKV